MHLFTQARQVLHVSFAALDFLVENHAVEPFASLEQLQGKIQIGARDEAESTNVLLHHRFGVFNSFGYFDLLFPSQKWNLTHLLEIHPHGVIENVDLCFRSLVFLLVLVRVFLTILVAIHFGSFNNVDLQASQPR